MPTTSRIAPQAAPSFHPGPKANRTGQPLPVVRRDRPAKDSAQGPAYQVTLERNGPLPGLQATGKDRPAPSRTDAPKDRATGQPAAVGKTGETQRATSRQPATIPDAVGPRDTGTRVQAYGGLNVRRSSGGEALTVHA